MKTLRDLLIFSREEATTASCAFCLRQEKDDQKVVLEDKDLEIIGAPIIKYGDSTVIVQHSETGLWLSYKVSVVTVKYSDNGASHRNIKSLSGASLPVG